MTILPVNNFILNSVTCVLYSEDVDYCILIDCGEYETLKPVLDRINKKVKAVLLTNGHSFNYVNRGKKLFPYDTLEEKARIVKGSSVFCEKAYDTVKQELLYVIKRNYFAIFSYCSFLERRRGMFLE